jgi:hypothetical protein
MTFGLYARYPTKTRMRRNKTTFVKMSIYPETLDQIFRQAIKNLPEYSGWTTPPVFLSWMGGRHPTILLLQAWM